MKPLHFNNKLVSSVNNTTPEMGSIENLQCFTLGQWFLLLTIQKGLER